MGACISVNAPKMHGPCDALVLRDTVTKMDAVPQAAEPKSKELDSLQVGEESITTSGSSRVITPENATDFQERPNATETSGKRARMDQSLPTMDLSSSPGMSNNGFDQFFQASSTGWGGEDGDELAFIACSKSSESNIVDAQQSVTPKPETVHHQNETLRANAIVGGTCISEQAFRKKVDCRFEPDVPLAVRHDFVARLWHVKDLFFEHRPGTVLNPVTLLGTGGQGAAFLCEVVDLRGVSYKGLLVVIKVMIYDNVGSYSWNLAKCNARFQMDHAPSFASIAMARDFRFVGDYKWYRTAATLLPYVKGVTLEDLMWQMGIGPNQKWSEDAIKLIACDLFHIIHDLRRARAAHRDIKPANVMLNAEDGRVVLIDCDLMASDDTETYPGFTNWRQLPVGTVGYHTTVRTRKGEIIAGSSDFYSLAATVEDLARVCNCQRMIKLMTRVKDRDSRAKGTWNGKFLQRRVRKWRRRLNDARVSCIREMIKKQIAYVIRVSGLGFDEEHARN